MIRSMTAFGRARSTVGGKDITVEIKSVNNRYFDCSVKLPRSISFLEEKIKPYLQSRGITRGKVDVFIALNITDSPATNIQIDEHYADAYISALRELGSRFGLCDDISIMSVAQNRDIFVVQKPEENAEEDWTQLSGVLGEATDAFLAGRLREGENIWLNLCEKVRNIRQMTDQIEKLSILDVTGYREKLEGRLREVLADNRISFDENRILTECAIFADRIAIDEELVRLRSHFDGFDQILESDEPVGRKLDFLVQEMNREINTIGSKCQNSAIAHTVVDVKCEIEKIREQIQNIE